MEEEISQLPKRVALVTGASKGIGLEICRQLASNGVKVLLTARDEKRGLEALQKLKVSGLSDVSFHQLDVTDQTSVACLADFIETKFKKLDILVNNAGISGTIVDPEVQRGLKLEIEDIVGPKAKSLREVLKQSYQVGEACLRTNYFGVKLVTEELIPLLQLSETPTIVNVSSTLGQLKLISNEEVKNELSNIDSLTEEKVDEVVREFLEDLKEDLLETKGWPIIFSAYIVSKAALNGYTRILAKKFPNIATNAVSPGFVKTDLNHNSGKLSVEEGARGPVRLALFPNGGASGLFYDQMEVSTF
ncbi:Salutaridine reductase [Actinidia chinensis var. chinensis]|uniref:Short-chain dehydrogenase/reductase n=1 Tax=Actinidia chinensis var. chinensis TaxID=1590841 RepID=A0A2R6Q8C0_ACTCC|nr:Salutaridine reductase [Actinidia chinensis var. chinensis]